MIEKMRGKLAGLIDRQHRQPAGLLGALIGERMLMQHAPETGWTVEQLAIAPQDRVLEIGFGAGRGLALAAARATRGYVVGVDLSPTMVWAARRRNVGAVRAGRMALARGDVTALPLADATFDKVLSIHTFYFWPEPALVIADLARILRPGGRCVITLSTGRVQPSGERVYGELHAQLETRVLPELLSAGFREARLEHGPDSRDYTSVGVIGTR